MFKIFNKKYQFFQEKIDAVTKTIWDFEFKISKSRQVREGVRQDRDRAVEAAQHIKVKSEGAKGDDKKKLEDELAKMVENKERYEKQMKMIDDQIQGANATENSDAVIGLNEQLKSLVELKQMYKSYSESL